jgi:hypothetical protein
MPSAPPRYSIAKSEVFHEHPPVLQPGLFALGIPRISDADLVRTNLGARSATMGHGVSPYHGTWENHSSSGNIY